MLRINVTGSVVNFVKYHVRLSNVGLEEWEATSGRHACVRVCAHVCTCVRARAVTPGGKRCLMQDRRGLAEGQEKHRAPRSTAPPPESRPSRVYLTLRVLSSLDQESVEGKEGRDEEEVTSALLPIWKGKKKHTRENTKQTKNPTTYPGFSPGFPVKES